MVTYMAVMEVKVLLDLMKLFYLHGVPSEEQGIGDIEKFNYVFLGNYCDFGFNSLEVDVLIR